METIKTLKELQQIRILSHSLRLRIVHQLRESPKTMAQVGKALDIRINKLYYHFKLLEKHGLIHVVETRKKGNSTEKLYQPLANLFVADRSIFGHASDRGGTILQMMDSQYDAAFKDLELAIQTGTFTADDAYRCFNTYTTLHLNEEQLEALRRRIVAWIDDIKLLGNSDGSHQIGLVVCFFTKAASRER